MNLFEGNILDSFAKFNFGYKHFLRHLLYFFAGHLANDLHKLRHWHFHNLLLKSNLGNIHGALANLEDWFWYLLRDFLRLRLWNLLDELLVVDTWNLADGLGLANLGHLNNSFVYQYLGYFFDTLLHLNLGHIDVLLPCFEGMLLPHNSVDLFHWFGDLLNNFLHDVAASGCQAHATAQPHATAVAHATAQAHAPAVAHVTAQRSRRCRAPHGRNAAPGCQAHAAAQAHATAVAHARCIGCRCCRHC